MKICEDFKAYSKGSLAKGISTLVFNPCFHAIALYRIACFFYHHHLMIVSKFIWYINRVLFNVDLDFRSEIGGGLRLIHGFGVVVGCEVQAGKNLTLYQGVTLGGTNNKRRTLNGKDTGQPLIGENVIVYTDAKIFGPVIVPDEAYVKAGQIVSKDEYFCRK